MICCKEKIEPLTSAFLSGLKGFLHEVLKQLPEKILFRVKAWNMPPESIQGEDHICASYGLFFRSLLGVVHGYFRLVSSVSEISLVFLRRGEARPTARISLKDRVTRERP